MPRDSARDAPLADNRHPVAVPPPVALAITVLGILYLLRREAREQPMVSKAIWIPMLWLMINGSRQVSQWLGDDGTLAAQRLEAGTIVDKVAYSALIFAGLCVLVSRRASLVSALRRNVWLVLFILYAGISFVWSDTPLVTLKRWTKAVGDPVMILVLCTEAAPARAIASALRRCAYVLIPLSVLFCKYYLNLGRNFDGWGNSAYTGVALDKNMLGYLLFAFGLFFVAALVTKDDAQRDDGTRRIMRIVNLTMLAMIGWLFMIANSKTPLLAFAVGATILVAMRVDTFRRHYWPCTVAAVLFVTAAEALFSVTTTLVEAAGRDLTFTGRTGLWETLLREPINPIMGVGYASFWLGERLQRFWSMYPTSPPVQAHNGYLEVYLNLGLIGLFLLTCVLITGLVRIRRKLRLAETSDERFLATFGLAFATAYLFYNVTEATFQGLNPLFLIFLLLGFEYGTAPRVARPQPVPPAVPQRPRGQRQWHTAHARVRMRG